MSKYEVSRFDVQPCLMCVLMCTRGGGTLNYWIRWIIWIFFVLQLNVPKKNVVQLIWRIFLNYFLKHNLNKFPLQTSCFKWNFRQTLFIVYRVKTLINQVNVYCGHWNRFSVRNNVGFFNHSITNRIQEYRLKCFKNRYYEKNI